jgi:hypothetical protein
MTRVGQPPNPLHERVGRAADQVGHGPMMADENPTARPAAGPVLDR